MVNLPLDTTGLVETLLADWIVEPLTNYGENTLGFSFLNASRDRVVVRISKLAPPPPPPRCDAEVDWSYGEYGGTGCNLTPGHDLPHHGDCNGWEINFWPENDDLAG